MKRNLEERIFNLYRKDKIVVLVTPQAENYQDTEKRVIAICDEVIEYEATLYYIPTPFLDTIIENKLCAAQIKKCTQYTILEYAKRHFTKSRAFYALLTRYEIDDYYNTCFSQYKRYSGRFSIEEVDTTSLRPSAKPYRRRYKIGIYTSKACGDYAEVAHSIRYLCQKVKQEDGFVFSIDNRYVSDILSQELVPNQYEIICHRANYTTREDWQRDCIQYMQNRAFKADKSYVFLEKNQSGMNTDFVIKMQEDVVTASVQFVSLSAGSASSRHIYTDEDHPERIMTAKVEVCYIDK